MPIDHTVSQGDCISSVALETGFFPDTIWDDPKNAELKEKRGNPNVLHEGDIVVIPDKRIREESKPTGARHRFRRKGVPEILRLVLLDDCGQPRANLAYVLSIDGKLHKGKTNSKGELKHPIPPDARDGRLVVSEGTNQEQIPLHLGHLDPVTEITGVQMRLSNLAFDCGPPDGTLNPATLEAIRAFQSQNGLNPTGELDDATRQKIKERHGS